MRPCLIAAGTTALLALASEISLAQQATPEEARESVTVYPIVLTTPRRIPESLPERLAEVVGLLLERAGMDEIEIADEPFAVAADEKLADAAKRFAVRIREHPPGTATAVLGHVIADEKSINEIRTIVVDRKGSVLLAASDSGKTLTESKTPPRDPMTACLFLAGRLGKLWDLEDPQRADPPEGKMAERMRDRSGLPPREDLQAMQAREQALARKARRGTLAVYPIHLWQGWERGQARELAEAITEAGLFTANAAESSPEWDVAGDPNELKVLWDTARGFRDHLRANPLDADYALLVDCGLSPSNEGRRAAGHVHLVLCTGRGDWVLVDLQNSHHDDFQRIDPKSVDGCCRLALARLKKRLASP